MQDHRNSIAAWDIHVYQYYVYTQELLTVVRKELPMLLYIRSNDDVAYVHTYVCILVCKCVLVCVHTYSVSVYKHMYVCMYVCACMCVYP